MATCRTFVAIPIDRECTRPIGRLVEGLRVDFPGIRWPDPSTLHITLVFLGDVEVPTLPDICGAVEEAVANSAAFVTRVQGVGAFPSLRRARTVWIGFGDGADRIVSLQQSVEAGLIPLGHRPEQREFRPHVTIGRPKPRFRDHARLADRLSPLADWSPGELSVREVQVLTSQLSPRGPKYDLVGRIPLV